MARDVFISYRSEDKEAAQRICARLEHENISCWMAPRDIPIGKEWATAIVEGLQRCKAFLVILSSNSKAAKQISREAELADNQGIPIFTFRIEDVQPPPGLLYFLGNIQWLDAFGGQFDAALVRLVEVIKQGAAYPAQTTTIRAAPSMGSSARRPSPAVESAEPSVEAPGFSTPLEPPSSEADAPEETPAFSEASASPGRAGDSPVLWMGIGAAVVVVLCLIGWFWFHRLFHEQVPVTSSNPPADAKTFPERKPVRVPRRDAEAEARAVAERFLKERDSGNLDAAWGEYTESFRNTLNENQWKKNAEVARRKRGGVDYQFNGCNPDRQGGYVCDYTLLSASGSSEDDRLTLAKQDEGWAISGGIVKRSR